MAAYHVQLLRAPTMAVMSPHRLKNVSRHIGKFVGGLGDCEKQFEIDTPIRAAHFLSQLIVESQDFTKTSESMFYSTASQIHETFSSRISIDDAKKLSSATKQDVYWASVLLQGNGYLIKALRDDRPNEPRNMSQDLEVKAYGKSGNKGAGLIQLTKDTKRQVLAFLCSEYRRSTDQIKPKPLQFIETLQGIPPAGTPKAAVVALADQCSSVDSFVDSFNELLMHDPYIAAVSAGAFWYLNGLNDVADNGDGDDVIRDVSALVNRGSLSKQPKALEERKRAFKRIYPLFQAIMDKPNDTSGRSYV